MNFRGFSKAAGIGIAVSGFSMANAQFAPSTAPVLPYHMSSPSLFSYRSDHDMWNTILIISGIIFVVGLADSDTALTVIGAAGVVLSLVETQGGRFRFGPAYKELELAHRGPFSFGFSSFTRGEYGPMDHIRPCVSYAIRF